MKQMCYICKISYGDKEPMEDNSETHGLCDICFKEEIQRIKREVKKYNGKSRRKNFRVP
jgi:hypothetical protein